MNESYIEDLKIQKRTRYFTILTWEQKRSEETQKHKDILNTLISRILAKVANSREANLAVVKFLKERGVSSKQYSEILLSEIGSLPDPDCLRISKSLTFGLSSVNSYQKQLSNNFIELGQKIQ
ncbi:hypothetical protein SteCoe_2381 [Stentor coeruleus]|uniref:Uncharacterized protein n=1 Tax=Stentor coeruleus TaxID=5963 RepID=A0A1R2CZP7_9CILI|nr:hypothetical protein SteCoe_2381 [Stentor coeruleus]